MEVVFPRCCGLDIHRKLVVACVLTPGDGPAPRREVRSFGAMTADLLALADWLETNGVTHVAMESTGVYWKPVFNLLEDRFTLLLVNPQHIRRFPDGRPTSKTANGLPTCCATGCSPPALCRTGSSGNCGN